MPRARRHPCGGAIMLLLGCAGFVSGVALLIAFEASPPLVGTEAVCRIAKAAKSGNCMQYVVEIGGGGQGVRGEVNGDGREVRSGIMVIPIDAPQIETVVWEDDSITSSDDETTRRRHRRGVGGGNLTCFVYTHQVCPMQEGFWPHQLNEGCCPRNDASEGGAQGTWIYKDEQVVRSERRWFPVLGAGLVVLGLLLVCAGRLVLIGFGFACVMRWLDERSDVEAGSRGGAAKKEKKQRGEGEGEGEEEEPKKGRGEKKKETRANMGKQRQQYDRAKSAEEGA